MTTVLAIDQGTSGTKAVLVDREGHVLGLAEVAVRPTYGPAGAVEQSPHELLDSVLAAGRDAVARAGQDPDVVTLANQGETVLAWDPATGRPLSDMIVWQDRRADSVCAELRGQAKDIAGLTGLVLDPYFSAPKMAWLRRNVTSDGVVTTSDSWLLHQLTGRFVTDASTASRSLLTNLDDVAWNSALTERFGLSQERLPEIVGCDEIVGETTAFGTPTKVGGLIVDQQAALAAQGCLEPGQSKCTFGTGAFLLVNSGVEPVRSSAGLAASAAWRVAGQTTYCLDGQVYTAASAVRWLQQLGFVKTAADLDEVAAADAEGVLCVPALAGLAAPWWRPEASATFTGMKLATSSAHLVRAVLEGIAAQVAELATAVTTDLQRPLDRLRVDGGLTRSHVLLQAVADVLQMPVEVYPSPHATAMGAAAFARLAVEGGRLQDKVVGWSPSRTCEPRWSPDRAADFRARWGAVAAAN